MLAGSVLWHQFDYDGEEMIPVIPHLYLRHGGVPWRISRKNVFYFYQEPVEPETDGAHLQAFDLGAERKERHEYVKVYSNALEVELFLNGKSLGVKPGGMLAGLRHSPRFRMYPMGISPAKSSFESNSLD